MSSESLQLKHCGRLRRRSKRLKLVFPVEVIAVEEGGEAFRETARMISVNANGGLLALKASVREGQRLRLVNRHTTEQQECRVVNIKSSTDGHWAVGVEFTCSAANFWQISFPPPIPRAVPVNSN